MHEVQGERRPKQQVGEAVRQTDYHGSGQTTLPRLQGPLDRTEGSRSPASPVWDTARPTTDREGSSMCSRGSEASREGTAGR